MLDTLNDRCAYLTRVLPSGHVLDVVSLTFGRARLLLSRNPQALGAENAW